MLYNAFDDNIKLLGWIFGSGWSARLNGIMNSNFRFVPVYLLTQAGRMSAKHGSPIPTDDKTSETPSKVFWHLFWLAGPTKTKQQRGRNELRSLLRVKVLRATV
jgi:hypothetical protein